MPLSAEPPWVRSPRRNDPKREVPRLVAGRSKSRIAKDNRGQSLGIQVSCIHAGEGARTTASQLQIPHELKLARDDKSKKSRKVGRGRLHVTYGSRTSPLQGERLPTRYNEGF